METIINYEVKEVTWPERTFITKRDTISLDKLGSFFTEAYGSIYATLQKIAIQSNEPPFAIYYSVDETNKMTDVAAAVSIPSTIKEIRGFKVVTIHKAKALMVDYQGPYENMAPAYAAIEQQVNENGYQKEWMIEQYCTDPMVEKDPAKWKTSIYFLVK